MLKSLYLSLTICQVLHIGNVKGFESSIFKSHNLLLVPQSQKPCFEREHWIKKRSVDPYDLNENEFASEQNSSGKKLHRLAHNVKVETDIRFRYAITLISDKVHNSKNYSREVYLTLILPETAFISRFAIEVDGQLYVAYVKEKEAALKIYQDAVDSGKTAGHVGVSARHSNNFHVSVNTEANSKITFYLLYEELLHRKQGFYHHVVNITPRQKLGSFSITMRIMEQRKITMIEVPKLRKYDINIQENIIENETEIERISPREVRVYYKPQLSSLQSLLKSRHALQFSVNYDVERPNDGEILVVDGYFVHFVAPENIRPLPKHVVFVLDTSGSMGGKKILQTKDAMRTIINELNDQDFISILDFNTKVNIWNHYHDHYVKISDNIKKYAMDYVDSLEANGGTNINDAILDALRIVRYKKENAENVYVQPMVIFLTDGNPTEGVVNAKEIIENVVESNVYEVPIFALAFGRGADFDSLKVLALRNYGFARKIYVAADASLQLQGFYREISSPMLRNVRFVYQNDSITQNSLTSTSFHSYYKGGEMVVAGHLMSPAHSELLETQIKYKVLANDADGEYEIDGRYIYATAPVVETDTILLDFVVSNNTIHSNILERLWAYLTIQDLFKALARGEFSSCPESYNSSSVAKRSTSSIEDESTDIERILETVGDQDIYICDHLEYALYLSLKYEFVTPLTSLVIVKPDDKKSAPGTSEDEGGHDPRITLLGNHATTLSQKTRIGSFLVLISICLNLTHFYI
ncbi:inter-alpha-trypsin inhibitor heavy chain H3 [Lepeophtheirus salmonis]|nr:inter-alpha-trypsin inhibitor heavy chain H3-like [Lepeophtheirus salmonis]XP_040572274.1 inter-alpha-trypsin inhibitor heavy chain H3-like [Lepeophtheirus salmonis]XP_040572275.1 inter-alpha-trypsin inhibitor heavy chain H3-like [Lepeophtheirus salmonis]XP_040572276.1 inter-alpha-trypsin inhibitor heavy chain H3-like [Lepeophtheirus salmonis]